MKLHLSIMSVTLSSLILSTCIFFSSRTKQYVRNVIFFPSSFYLTRVYVECNVLLIKIIINYLQMQTGTHSQLKCFLILFYFFLFVFLCFLLFHTFSSALNSFSFLQLIKWNLSQHSSVFITPIKGGKKKLFHPMYVFTCNIILQIFFI